MRGLCAAIACAVALNACAARVPPRPAGAETPDPQAVDAFNQATKSCAGLKTLTAELRLSGRAGTEKLRGTLHIGLAAPGDVRVEALAPFGQPFFILAGRDNRATLLLPRDDRVLRDAPVADVLERLTGLSLTATDLRLLLTGCLSVPANPANGRAFSNGWRAVTLASGTVAYLRSLDGRPTVVAADQGSWRVDYAMHQGGWPRRVRIRSLSGDVDMSADIGEFEMNTEIDSRAFEVNVPANAAPMTLDHLRSVVPLRATQ
jgi:outer membrane lipoprotein-sorting protein